MKNLIIAIAVLAIFAGTAFARGPELADPVPYDGHKTRGDIVWSDDIESGAPGWTTADMSGNPHYWHIDTYMAYAGNSWWCGTFAYDADGGYGNSWTQWLTSPYVDWSGYTYPVLLYQFRNDTEIGYDYSFAEAESMGSFVPLNRGYDGVIPWGQAGFYLGNKDNPAKFRFAFYSDAAWSDADGYYLSNGGAFSVDDVQVIDYNTSVLLYLEDADANVSLVTSVPAAAGNYWSIRSNVCQAWSPSHYWGITSPDTTFVQPNLQNWLYTPVVDVSGYAPAIACTVFAVQQFFMSPTYGGSWQEWTTNDGWATGIRTGWWHGHQCQYGYGPCDHFGMVLPAMWLGYQGTGQVGAAFVMLTDAFGQDGDPALCPEGWNSSGITIDDASIECTAASPVESSSWGAIKSMYR
jgi:hypothetical protein